MLDLTNLSDNDMKWMRSVAQGASANRNPDKSDPLSNATGVTIFNRYLADFEPATHEDQLKFIMLSTTEGTDEYKRFEKRVGELRAEYVTWMRGAADARYAQEDEQGNPVPEDVRERFESEIASSFEEARDPDFFSKTALPIANAFAEGLQKYDSRAFMLAMAIGMPLEAAQQLVDSGVFDTVDAFAAGDSPAVES